MVRQGSNGFTWWADRHAQTIEIAGSETDESGEKPFPEVRRDALLTVDKPRRRGQRGQSAILDRLSGHSKLATFQTENSSSEQPGCWTNGVRFACVGHDESCQCQYGLFSILDFQANSLL